jgi:hypothetical protein
MKAKPLPLIPHNRKIFSATPRPQVGVISWNMNTTCNYRCSYCTQRFVDDRGRWARDSERFIGAFARLPGIWEVKLSGGEPFVHPNLIEIVSALAHLHFEISVVTNFSANDALIDSFVRVAGPSLRIFSCSLHLEYVDPPRGAGVAAWIERCVRLRSMLAPSASLCVTIVATQSNFPRLPALAAAFENAGLVFKVQPEKQDREVVSYTNDQLGLLTRMGGHNQSGRIAADFGGQPCWAGSRYFILDDIGNAYRCYPARRYGVERMGNFLDESFILGDAPSPCRYRYCNCTVPIAREMMPLDAGVDSMSLEQEVRR